MITSRPTCCGTGLLLAALAALGGCTLPPDYEANRHEEPQSSTGSLLGPSESGAHTVGDHMNTPGLNMVPSGSAGGSH
jgi:hypothetical protein